MGQSRARVDGCSWAGVHGNHLIRPRGSSSTCVLEEDAHGDAETRGTIRLFSSFYKPRLFKAAGRLLYFVPVADLAFGPCQDQKEWKNVSAYLCLPTIATLNGSLLY